MPRGINSYDQTIIERRGNYSSLTANQLQPNLQNNNLLPSGNNIYTQPRDIITNGLVCYLDAAIGNSYPRSGTTWFDLSGNGNNGTLTNGPTYSSTNGGVIVFDGVDDFVTVSLNLATTNNTIFAIARWTGSDNQRVISSNNNNWLMGWWQEQTNKYYAEAWVSPANGGVVETSWICYAATGDISTDSWQLYRNGVSIVGPNNLGTQGPNGIRLGGSGITPTENAACQVGLLMAYNRVLSAAEIAQNFNATRARFGL